MKLQRDFFSSLRIKKLRRLPEGDTCTIVYLKLQLLSITTEGHLKFKHVFDSFAEEMAEDIDEDIEAVQKTIDYLLKRDLMLQNGDDFILPYAQDNIGSECASAERMRNLRKKKETSQCDDKSSQSAQNVTEVLRTCDVEKEIDIEIDNKRENIKEKSKKTKHKYGQYQHVLLTDDEYNRLGVDYGDLTRNAAIKFLDEWIEEKGYKSKSHNLAIRRWVVDAVTKGERNGRRRMETEHEESVDPGAAFDIRTLYRD